MTAHCDATLAITLLQTYCLSNLGRYCHDTEILKRKVSKENQNHPLDPGHMVMKFERRDRHQNAGTEIRPWGEYMTKMRENEVSEIKEIVMKTVKLLFKCELCQYNIRIK